MIDGICAEYSKPNELGRSVKFSRMNPPYLKKPSNPGFVTKLTQTRENRIRVFEEAYEGETRIIHELLQIIQVLGVSGGRRESKKRPREQK